MRRLLALALCTAAGMPSCAAAGMPFAEHGLAAEAKPQDIVEVERKHWRSAATRQQERARHRRRPLQRSASPRWPRNAWRDSTLESARQHYRDIGFLRWDS